MNELIHKFYKAFTELDAETMASCYHAEVVFEDPAFGKLKGEHAGNMWRMLCASQKGKDFRVTYSDIQTNKHSGSASWQAFYTFSKTGSEVHNSIVAQFEFKDGSIIKHTDQFNLHKWAKQALGFKGFLLGGTSFFRNKLQRQTNILLKAFEDSL
ncbi:Ketosteroid isomerase-related protein [Formosa sp. Hel1_31_208]|uniref:nuclear transport factor 2 family protein n=1 Tax=Formosa sp. Hel1_31_208 TaxID=1798225 RepID=UPI00087C4C80|nr:nuclear transport factor 2 family protein [Formosa sp. Hel1_31_208]SDS29958.1 Ketosteroid isomerase-related protein [Formosa sp. Hel1_31_208]